MMDIEKIHHVARERFKGSCRVCKVCNGRACAGEMPGMGGIGTGSSFMANHDSLARIKLKMRVIHDAADPNLTCHFFGLSLEMPILVAPVAGTSFNMANAMGEGEYLEGMLAGGVRAGSLAFTCDGPDPMIFDVGVTLLKKYGGRGIPTIKPRPEEDFLALVQKAEEAGVPAVATDIDAAGIILMRRAGQPVRPWPVEAWKRIISKVRLPVIFKGIMTPEDARLAVMAGAGGIVVSNHGGRVLDHTPGTADVLPEIAAQMRGKIRVFVDGGVRNGVDVLKMLALGAEAVLVGRPMAIASVGGGAEGVSLLLGQYADELRSAMLYTGCKSLSEINGSILC